MWFFTRPRTLFGTLILVTAVVALPLLRQGGNQFYFGDFSSWSGGANAGSLVGASLGFLWYNCYPAEVFMGDVGSLALGGAIGTVGVIIKQEILLISIGGVFVLEALSVMLQVLSFKIRGKRVFRMAPLHHHFELLGWKESKVVVRFWIVALIFALFSLTTLKLR